MTRRPLLALACSLALAAAGAGCRGDGSFVERRVAGWVRRQAEGFERERDVERARRVGGVLLVALDGLIRIAPRNAELLTVGARANTTYACALLEDEDPDRACVLYAKARKYGLRALAGLPGFTRAVERGGSELDTVLADAERPELEALFWTAYAWGLRINLRRDHPEELAGLPIAQQLMQPVLDRDPGFYYAAPHVFFGVADGMRSSALGGDLAASRRHFETAIRLAHGRYLLARVLFARFYAVQAQDRAVFVRELRRVRRARPDLLPEQALANTVARRRAARLLKQVDDLILPDADEEEPGK